MDSEQFTQWLKAVSIQLNKALNLVPPMAWERDVNMLLDQSGAEKLLLVADTLGTVDTEKIKSMAEQYPDLGNQLARQDAQQEIRSWVSKSRFAAGLKTLRLMAVWVTSPSNSQLEWQIEDIPNDDSIYRTILRVEQDEKGICNNQGEC